MKREINSSAPPPIINSTFAKEINTETVDLHSTGDQTHLTEVDRTFHPSAETHTIFSSSNEIFLRTHCIIGQKLSLKKLSKTETTSNIVSDNRIKLEIEKENL